MQNWTVTIEGNLCELPENFDFETTFTAADIRYPELRAFDFCPTFTLQKSPANDKALGFPFDVDSITNVSRTVTKDCIITNGLKTYTGSIFGIAANKGEYSCQFFTGNKSLFNLIKGLKLSDLDFSEYDMSFTATDIANLYSGDLGVIFDFCQRGNIAIGGANNNITTDIRYLLPAFQYYKILNKILADQGWTLSSNFCETDHFKTWYLLHTWGELVTDETTRLKSKVFNYYQDTAINIDGFFDWSNGYLENGTNITISVSNPYPNKFFTLTDSFRGKIKGKLWVSDPSMVPATTAYTMRIIYGPDKSTLSDLFSYNVTVVKIGGFIEFETAIINFDETLYYGIVFDFDATAVADWYQIEVIPELTIPQNASINMSLQLPDMLQTDFLKLIRDKFNLFFEADYDLKTLTLEPFNDFVYGKSEAVDISEFVDSQSVEIEFLELENKIILRQQQDSNDINIEGLGTKEIDTGVQVNETEKIIESIDSAVYFDNVARLDIDILIPVLLTATDQTEFSNDFNYKSVKYEGLHTVSNVVIDAVEYSSDLRDVVLATNVLTDIPIFSTEYYDSIQISDNTNIVNSRTNTGFYDTYWSKWIGQYFDKIIRVNGYFNERFILNFSQRTPLYFYDHELGGATFYCNMFITKSNNYDLSEIELVKLNK